MCVSGEWGEGGELYREERLGKEAGVRSGCLGVMFEDFTLF